MPVTLKDIAEEVGVSTSTISKVLNGYGNHISPEVQKKITDAVNRHGYIPNSVAQSLKMKRSKTLGFILPDIGNTVFTIISQGIENCAARNGYSVIMMNTNDDREKEKNAVRLLTSRMVDAIIFTRTLLSATEDLQSITECKKPIVLIDRDININKTVGRVFIDTVQATYDMTKHLIDRGCKNIAFISATVGSQYKRYNGYSKALSNHGLTTNPELVFSGNYDIETGYRGAKTIVSKGKVDGIVCGSDLIAVGVIQALQELNIDIPGKVRVAGFDDLIVSSIVRPNLTTIRQPFYQIGQEAAQMIFNHLEKGEPLYSKQLDYELIVREST